MNDRGPDIDTIVAEVVRRLRAAAPPPGPRAAPTAAGVLTVPERLVTLATLDGWLAGVRQVVLRPDAVVTPAARDELRRREIAVARGTGSTQAGAARVNLFVAELVTSDAAAQAVAAGVGEAADVVRLAGARLPQAVQELAVRLSCPLGRGLLLVAVPATAVVLANRHRGLRAAAAATADDWQQAIDAVGANVLAVDPGRVSAAELTAMVRLLVGTGGRACPVDLRPALEGA